MADWPLNLNTVEDVALVALGLLVLTVVAGWLVTSQVLKQLRRQAILDHPNERSSHEQPTPRGGGWGILLVLFPCWTSILSFGGLPFETFWLLGAAALLAWVSWLDDLRTIGARYRFGVQIIAVFMGLFALTPFGPITQGWLPFWLDRLLIGVAWLWFMNLYNFMDGIDGLAGSETAAIGLGLTLVVLISPTLGLGWSDGALLGVTMAGASLGFLLWNWSPAKLFMGDVGSIPLGFLIGWLLFALAAQGYLFAAIILPLYFCVDASVTLVRRVISGAKPWEPHREHFYQRATQRGLSHGATVTTISATNIGLIACAVLAVFYQAWALIPAGIVMVLALWFLTRDHGVSGPPTGL
ncbi:MAG: glycosyltransferase family 4 protein [Pseudomonadota bacterium]